MVVVGFTCLNNLGNCGTSDFNKCKVPRLFMSAHQEKNQKKYNRLGTWAEIKKRTAYEKQKLRQATEPIDNNGGNMYALA